jgi:hypothetical protein
MRFACLVLCEIWVGAGRDFAANKQTDGKSSTYPTLIFSVEFEQDPRLG